MNKRSRGAWGEEQAVAFLSKKEYTVLERNYYAAGSEIDVIAQKAETLVFIEVKVLGTYRREELGRIVGPRKRRKIRESAGAFLQERPQYADWKLRCDVIAVIPGKDEPLHLENAF